MRLIFLSNYFILLFVLAIGIYCDPTSTSETLLKNEQSITLGLNDEEFQKLRESAEKRQFQADVGRTMKLIVNSLYKNKEIFLRELISNAADALEKVRFSLLTNPTKVNEAGELAIKIKANKESRTLHIIDNGVGMTKNELLENLGTIAKSGAVEFLSKFEESKSEENKTELIGQFGVGFYSAFLVSNKVTVVSKSDSDDQYVWESDSNSYLVYPHPHGNTLKRGTEIVLPLTEEAEDYLQQETLIKVAKNYSQFIDFPLYVWTSHVETVKAEADDTINKEKESEDSSVEDVKKAESKPVEKVIWDWQLINGIKPIWRRKASEVNASEYNDFYRAQFKDNDDPLVKIHFYGEGDIRFNSLLFLPARAPTQLFQMQESYNDRVMFYVRRTFISNIAEKILPRYLAFLLGIVESDDVPLNVSRETIQESKLLKTIKKKIVRKVLDTIAKLSDEDFDKFWKEYSMFIKLGVATDPSNHNKLVKLLRFHTSKSGTKLASLNEYVSRMKPGQEEIYYLTGSSLEEVKSSPLAEGIVLKGYEVLYMIDPLDEYVVQSLTEYEKKKLRSLAKDGVELDKSEEAKAKKAKQKENFMPLINWLQEKLKDQIEKVELSDKLSDSPCALLAHQFGWSGNMERIMHAQTSHKSGDASYGYYAAMKKTLEINPRHPVVKELNSRVKADPNDQELQSTADLLLDVAYLRSGYQIKDPAKFGNRLESVIRKNLDIGLDEKPDELDLTESEVKFGQTDEDEKFDQNATKERNQETDSQTDAKDEL